MGIIAYCPNRHRVKVKDDLAGKKGICPTCGSKFRIPEVSAEPDERPAPSAPAPVLEPAEVPPAAPAALPAPRASGLPLATVVSLDRDLAATLPRALPLAGQ